MVVDHPADTEIVRRRAVLGGARRRGSPCRRCGRRAPWRGRWTTSGRDVTALVAARDGRYLATLRARHLSGHRRAALRRVRSAGRSARGGGRSCSSPKAGCIPTDSSINLAVGQGRAVKPSGLALDAQDAAGTWREVVRRPGFPAGKNKSMLIDLAPARGARAAAAAHQPRDLLGSAVGGRAGRHAAAHRALAAVARRAAVPRLLADVVAARRRARDAGLRAHRQHGAALARPRGLPHALRRRRGAAGGRRRSLRDHERRRRAAARVPRAAGAGGAAGAATSC